MFFFKKESNDRFIINESSQREIIVHENETISLSTMVLTDTTQGCLFVRDTVVVEVNASFSGEITSKKVVVKGRVVGNITCLDELVVSSTAVIDGSFIAHKAIVEAGAIIKGSLSITEDMPESQLEAKILYAENILNHRNDLSKAETVQKGPTKEEPVHSKSQPLTDRKAVIKEESRVDARADNKDTSGDSWW